MQEKTRVRIMMAAVMKVKAMMVTKDLLNI